MTRPRKKEVMREDAERVDAVALGRGRLRPSPAPQLDRTPVAMPAGYGRPRSLQEMLATMVRAQVEMEKEGEDPESWDEANDFDPDMEEDFLLDMSPYTFDDLQDDSEGPEGYEVDTQEAPQEENSSEPQADAQELTGLEPQNDLPKDEA